MKPDEVILRFVEPGRWDLSSRLIAWFTQGKYSHVEFITEDGYALGARLRGGVKRRPYEYIGKRQYRLFGVYSPHDLVMSYANSQIGKSYDWLAILGFVFGRNWQNMKRWFCSELCVWCFISAGVEVLRVEGVNKITPDGLALSPFLFNVSAVEIREMKHGWRARQ